MGLMTGYPPRSIAFLIFLLLLGPLIPVLLTAHPQGPQRVPVPVPPVKGSPQKKDRSAFPPVPTFKDVAAEVGLKAVHISTGEKRYILESMSGGVGIFDCDNDGRPDLVMVNGSTVDRYRAGGDLMVTLYHQEPDGTFKDITKEAGLTRLGWGMGVAVADYDNDGKLDLFVSGYGGNALYRNLGDCKFEDVTEKAGVKGSGFMTGAAWGDYDRDGNVDLFVARYTHVDMNNLPQFGSNKYCRYKGVLVQCGPWGLVGESDFLYHNRGDGTFEEVSVKAGVHDEIGYYGLGVIWADYDDDGWPDLLVANDSVPNYLYHNNHDGTFTDEGMLTGLALSGEGMELGNMGVDFGDFDHSGRLGFFVTHFDVFPQVDTVETGARYREPVLLHRNNRDGTFDEVSKEAGLAALPVKCRRGAAFGDIFNTGNVDVFLLNVGETPSLLKNRNADGYHRVLFRLVGTKSNRAAIGARVTIRAAGVKQFSEVRGGGSYLSQNDLRQHFGLGTATKIDSVEIRWPSGKVEKLESIAADAIYTIVEAEGIRETKPLPLPAAGASSGSR